MGVGASSILLILVVVSLTLFASLALIQARADAALTEKTAVSAGAYYDADERAQRVIAALDDALANGEVPESVTGVSRRADGNYIFAIESLDGHVLNVTADLSGGSCRILNYRYENVTNWVGQSAGTLWQGG
jgi:hypothetical protein